MNDDFFNNIDGGADDFDNQVANIMNAAENLPATIIEDDLPVVKPSDEDANRNQNFALENLKNISKIADQSVRELFVLAKSTDSPRAWEVLAGMLKTQIDAAKTIKDMSDEKSSTVPSGGDVTNNITNNTTIIQSSEDLFDFLSDDSDNEKIDFVDAKVIEHNDQ